MGDANSVKIPDGGCVYFIGIGGIGMSGIARILKKRGYRVMGSDSLSSVTVKDLQSEGIDVYVGHDHTVHGVDVAVYSSAIGQANPEYQWFMSQNVPLVKRGHVLAWLLSHGVSVGVTGTHGKTTTSSLISFLTNESGLSPTAIVGGYVKNFKSNVLCGNGSLYVAEMDESDKSHLFYSPTISVITNLEPDHLDYYKDLDDIYAVFSTYLDGLAPNASVVYCNEDTRLACLVESKKVVGVSYGFKDGSRYQAKCVVLQDKSTRFQVWKDGEFVSDVEIALLGMHNVLNTLAAFAVLELLGVGIARLVPVVGQFAGVGRRMDVLFEADDLMVIDDYAHHPTEIQHVLKTLKVKGRRIVAVFQPHRYSRTKHLMQNFAHAFDTADRLYLTDIYSAGERPIEGVTVEAIHRIVAASPIGTAASVVAKDGIITALKKDLRFGDIVVFLGAGDVTHIAHAYAKIMRDGHAACNTAGDAHVRMCG